MAPATARFHAASPAAALEAYARHRRGAAGRLQVVELGAGTGALTQRIRPLKPVLVERDAGLGGLLRHRFPALEVRQRCASEALA